LIPDKYYSHGKLLLTGEYLVLEGALSLSIPVSFGQTLTVEKSSAKSILEWRSYEKGNIWFSASFELPSLKPVQFSDNDITVTLSKILSKANQLNPNILHSENGYSISTNLTFNRKWGLGSSSTLISNIAYWFDIDPFTLFWSCFKGSGYDIACARANSPILYRKNDQDPYIRPVSFEPTFSNNIFFVYTGKKADSNIQIEHYFKHKKNSADKIKRISDISEEMLSAKNLEDFEELINEHESILSEILNSPTIRQMRFHDFSGTVKSLGAWGGDFVMITWKENPDELVNYFNSKGLNTIISFDDIILV
jgi:mevalonate kinase